MLTAVNNQTGIKDFELMNILPECVSDTGE